MERPTSSSKAVARLRSSWRPNMRFKCKPKLRRESRRIRVLNRFSEKNKSMTKPVLMKFLLTRIRQMLMNFGSHNLSKLPKKVTIPYSHNKNVQTFQTKPTQIMKLTPNRTVMTQHSCYNNSETKENISMTL